LKLGKRLQHIEQMVTSNYDHIWDCCCDHGLLGASLLTRKAAKNIHFVDIVPELITQVESKLSRFYANSFSHWTTHCIDVAKLPLTQYGGKHLIIIAGVGGDLMIQFIKSIQQQFSHVAIDFLLCPVHHQFNLRKQLIALNFSLQHEKLIEEKKRFYEIILVSSTPNKNKKIHPVGEHIWQATTPEQAHTTKHYLAKTLAHYKRIQQGNTEEVEHIIHAYLKVSNEAE